MSTFFADVDWDMVWEATGSTVYMTAVAGLATFVLGLAIGLLLYATNEELLFKNRTLYSVLSFLVNIFRSIPFIILLILLIPITKIIVGSFLGPTAALPALILGAAPFYGRMVELALREVDKGVIEAAESMGATKFQIIYKVLIPEALAGNRLRNHRYACRTRRLHGNGRVSRWWWTGRHGLHRRIPAFTK